MDHLSLYDLNRLISQVLAKNLEPSYWVVAEIGELRINQKGHCYLELVEKDMNQIKARSRATIWSYTFRNLSAWFQGITGQELKTGMKILFNATVQYHELYGFSLNIRDIDAQYTLGERAKKRQEIISQLKADGIYEMNKELPLPIVPQRLAVISSDAAAGFGDFTNQLESNEFGYDFEVILFKSVMQGEQAEQSIIKSMHQVYEKIDKYDLLVIIRGGGAALDLDCFDGYEIGTHIAQFPIPVITGIGHERDETISDLVAHTKMKTPTAVAEFIITGCRNFEQQIDLQFERIAGYLRASIGSESNKLDQKTYQFQKVVKQKLFEKTGELINLLHGLNITRQNMLNAQQNTLSASENKLLKAPFRIIQNESNKLKYIENQIHILNPENVLERGFSITMINGKNISRIDKIEKDDVVKTLTSNQEIMSKFISRKKRI